MSEVWQARRVMEASKMARSRRRYMYRRRKRQNACGFHSRDDRSYIYMLYQQQNKARTQQLQFCLQHATRKRLYRYLGTQPIEVVPHAGRVLLTQ